MSAPVLGLRGVRDALAYVAEHTDSEAEEALLAMVVQTIAQEAGISPRDLTDKPYVLRWV